MPRAWKKGWVAVLIGPVAKNVPRRPDGYSKALGYKTSPIPPEKLKDAQDAFKGLAKYFATFEQKPEPAKSLGTIDLGQKIWRAGIPAKGVPACAACHGPAGAGMPAQYPRLSGQFAEYTEAQMKAFRDGVRANDPNGMMRTIALKMTDPEIKAVADYATGLR